MAQKRKPDQSKVIVAAALGTADRIGWDHLTLQDVARTAKLDVAEVRKLFPHMHDLLCAVLKNAGRETERDVKKRLGANWRDNLFEILMTRFDLLQGHRKGFLTLLPAALRKPETGLHLAKTFYEEMAQMIAFSGLPKRLLRPADAAVFGALYLSIVHVWSRDETPDLAKTMAAIDRRLDLLERFLTMTECR